MPLILSILLISAQTDFGIRTPGSSPSAAQQKSGGRSGFACHVAYVHDGDTFRCSDGTRVRLSAIDAPEMPGGCRPGRSCAPGNPYRAKATLERLITGRTVQCDSAGKSYNRVAAWCSLNGADLSCMMLRSGQAVRLDRFDPRGRLRRCA
jgi:endonuclease YncB( thermonuclease family)